MNKTQFKSRNSRKTQSKSEISQKPKILGWNTTDEDEIALRRWRGEIESMTVQALETAHPVLVRFACNRRHGRAITSDPSPV